MGGARQFTALLRKNLLLKTRRPCATCFELAAPVVLFMGLVFVRQKVDDDTFGPYTFEHNEIFPMSSTIARSLTGVFDNTQPWDMQGTSSGLDGNLPKGARMSDEDFDSWRMSESMREEIGNMIKDAACSGQNETLMGDALTKQMESYLSWNVSGKTLAAHWWDLDAVREGKWAREAVEEAQTWNFTQWAVDLDEARHTYLSSEWPRMIEDAAKRVDEEISKLNAELDSSTGQSGTRDIVEGWVDSACSHSLLGSKNASASWNGVLVNGSYSNGTASMQASSSGNSVNTSELAKELMNLREVLNMSGISDFLNGTSAAQMWKPIRSLMDMISADGDYSDDMSDMADSLADYVRDHSAKDLAEFADSVAWWVSHFVRTRSVVARFLGESPSEMWHMNWEETTYDTGVAPHKGLRTSMANSLYQGLKWMQNGTNADKSTQDARREIDKISKSMNTWMDDAEKSSYGNETKSVMSELNKFIDDINHYNMSGIENIMLPKWNSTWQTTCPQILNSTYLGEKVGRMQRGCPFYRGQVRNFARHNLSLEVARFHKSLANLNPVNASYRCPLSRLQREGKKVNATYIGETVQKFIIDYKEYTPDDRHNYHDYMFSTKQEVTQEKKLAQNFSKRVINTLMDNNIYPSVSCAGTQGPRRLASPMNDFFSELSNRKILVTPYKGESRELIHNLFVELAQSLTIKNPNSKLGDMPWELETLLRCPLVKAAVAMGIDFFMQDRLISFDSETDLETYARDNPKNVLIALVFRNADPATGNFPTGALTVDYSIRAHAQYLPQTSKILRLARNAMFGAVRMSFYFYIDLYFSHIQEGLGRSVARLRAKRGIEMETAGGNASAVGLIIGAGARTAEIRQLGMALQQFPAPQYKVDSFIRAIQHTMPMFLMLGWIYAVSLLVKEMVYEKQEKLRDVMRIQGLHTWVYWSSWMASAMIQFMFLVSLIVVILCGGKVLRHSDPLVIFCFFSCYSLATVSLSMLISSFFSRAKVAAACAGLVYYGMYLPYSFYNRYEDVLSFSGKNAFCLLSSTGMGIGSGIIAKWELTEEGVQWSNFATAPPITYSGAAPTDNFSLATVMMMLLIDSVVYQVLAWYVQKVRPGTLGLPQPLYFPFLPSYWLGSRQVQDIVESADLDDAEQKGNAKLECWEAPPSELAVVVKMRGLAKTFSRGKKALKGISLDMQKGTILGLLGHNGAGKSTTMAILTGMYPPTAGEIYVNGRSVQKDSHAVRQQLGVCLQHNALYEWITVEEHLSLFCCLKSVPWHQMKDTVTTLLGDIGLTAKRHAPAKALSGGMKRKLSIGIALSGGSQVITLDEPTAGIDATSRRDIWQLLAKQKEKRTILLSTHFMDEADILSDRIAIIAEGELTAIGTGMTLKKHYADKYVLTLVAADSVDADRLTQLVCAEVPDAEFAGSRGRELSYQLPGGSRGHFAGLFKKLQDTEARAALGIETYGLSAATMEEVFLQASSVHEEGLSGMVRNIDPSQAGIETPRPQQIDRSPSGDEVSTNSGSGSGSFENSNSGSGDRQTTGSDIPKERTDESPIIPMEPSGEVPPMSPQGMVSSHPEPLTNDNGDFPVDAKHSRKDSDQFSETSKNSKLHMKSIDLQVTQQDSGNTTPKTPKTSVLLWHGPKLWGQQFGALLRKRALSVRRDRQSWASQLLLPSAFVLLALIVAAALSVKDEEPALKLSTDMFIGTTSAGAVTSSMAQHVIPFASMRNDDFASDMLTSFNGAKGSGDLFVPVDLGENATDMSNYLMDNNQALLTSTYGAVGVGGSEEFRNVTLWFKTRAYHAVPVFTSLFNDMRLQMLGFNDTKITTWNHPLPKSQSVLEEEMTGRSQLLVDVTVAVTMLLAMGFIPASFVVYLVHEKSTNGKHQQLLTGISPTMYWLSNYCWDIMNYIAPLLVCFFIFQAFGVDAYSGRNSLAIFMLLLFYGICMTPLMYCFEPFFSVPSTAYVTLICINIFTGTFTVLATSVLDMVQQDEPELKPINSAFKAIFPWLLPNYSLGRGLMEIATNHYMNYAHDEFGVCIHSDGSCIKDPMAWSVIGKYLTYLLIMTPVWLSIRMCIEWGCGSRQLRKGLAVRQNTVCEKSVDDAVNKEAERICDEVAGGTAKDNLVISNLAKSFSRTRPGLFRKKAPATHAVRGLNVGVPSGECFGLLGVNGAGKTTTMRMITGDTDIGGGDIQVCGHSVQNQRDRARRHLGYCPQFDALPDKLTTRETLALYARIRGVPASAVQSTVEEMIQKMCLEAHQNTICEHLSGGNRRKLSTALALIGEPDVILLDEPSTGVDVGARRFLWDVIGDIRQRGHALVLTSHSMEECEVLCTRLTIMVNGQLRCLGTPLQLKAKYGGGYTLMVKALLAKEADSCNRIRDFVATHLREASLTEESVGLFRYGLGSRGKNGAADSEVPLASIFETFEQATKEGGELHGCVSDYTLSQTSLEEVFLHFSNEAIAPEWTAPEIS